MPGRLYNLDQLGLVHTYDSGGQLPLPGVILGNESLNIGFAPDEDPSDLGLDTFANFDNGYGAQTDGEGVGFLADFDTNSNNQGLYLVAVDNNDSVDGADVTTPGDAGRNADNAFLAVRLSGFGDETTGGVEEATQSVPSTGDALDTGMFTDLNPLDQTNI
jgi:hypothetical protein